MNGKIPSTGKLTGKDAQNYVKQQTHFKDVDK
jgi:hypothetical protein